MKDKKPAKKIKVKTENLKVGMYVVDVGKSWLNHPWLTKERLINNNKDIELLKQHGISEVLVDLARSTTAKTISDHLTFPPQEPPPSRPDKIPDIKTPVPPQPIKTSLHEEMPAAEKAYLTALVCVKKFITNLQSGREIDFDAVEAGVQGIVDSVFRNLDACLTLTKLQIYDEYTFTHCLNVAVLATTLGRHFSMSREEILNLGLGGVFHDIGKLRIPDEILNKPNKLNHAEWQVMKLHTLLGAFMLEKRLPKMSDNLFHAVLHHHEKWDGTGYPYQKKADEIDQNAYLCALADVYDALTSHRVYHAGILPHEAVKLMFRIRDQHFPGHYVDQFIKCLGIYPAGSVVRLSTNEIGVVVEVNHTDLLSPAVCVVINAQGYLMSRGRNINLADSSSRERHIVNVVNPRSIGIDPTMAFNISTGPPPLYA